MRQCASTEAECGVLEPGDHPSSPQQGQQIKRVKYMLILPRLTDEPGIRGEMKRCNSFSPTSLFTPTSSS
ncbi:hypothetical protein F7725_007803 [Dissostichus mawsoni]|uniref:Uncharacterized protein n=1 Tax=Dissostichus mawsoni TaxID=36200 RepID=A0A7J5Y5H3_DISMA|nr:hypothetical protein F7725_007803 [Dissostichus mawsoni]